MVDTGGSEERGQANLRANLSALMDVLKGAAGRARTYAARKATKSRGTASLKLNRDPLGLPEQLRAVTVLFWAKCSSAASAPSPEIERALLVQPA
jgi:hypothetical protein